MLFITRSHDVCMSSSQVCTVTYSSLASAWVIIVACSCFQVYIVLVLSRLLSHSCVARAVCFYSSLWVAICVFFFRLINTRTALSLFEVLLRYVSAVIVFGPISWPIGSVFPFDFNHFVACFCRCTKVIPCTYRVRPTCVLTDNVAHRVFLLQ